MLKVSNRILYEKMFVYQKNTITYSHFITNCSANI